MSAVSYLAEETPAPAVGIGQIFGEAFDFVRSEPAEFWGATLAFAITPRVLAEFPGKIGAVFSLFDAFVTLVYAGLIAAMVYDRACQEPVRMERAFRTLPRYRSLFALSILGGLGIALGLVALIIPGLFLISLWFVSTPASAVEQLTFGKAMSRSMELTRGNRLRLLAAFGICLVICLPPLAISLTTTGLPRLSPLPEMSGLWFLRAGLMTLYATIVAICSALIPAAAYVALRRAREGVLSDGVAAVFG
jgi:hypothetical protein